MKGAFVLLLALFACGVLCHTHSAQSCHFDRMMDTPALKERYKNFKMDLDLLKIDVALNTRADTGGLLRIPIVWHVLFDNDETRVTAANIEQEMIWLNQWYSATNAHYTNAGLYSDRIAVASDFNIQFELASIDPEGNSSDGINYIESTLTRTCDTDNVFFTDQGGQDLWDPTQYYNIYTCDLQIGVGVAFLPNRSVQERDGAILDFEQLGDDTFSGSTISHETGHFLGLFHPFNSDSCESDEDDNLVLLDDTPDTDMPVFDYVPADLDLACPDFPEGATYTRCNNIPILRNNMDYNFEPCLSSFTKGQVLQMRAFLSSTNFNRKTLTSSPALSPSCGTYDCTDKNCGDDGCGGSCGECASLFECNSEGVCESLDRPNVVCSSAIEIVPTLDGTSVHGDTTGLTGNPIPSCNTAGFFQANGPLWYFFTAANTGTITINTFGSFLDTTVSVTVGDCSDLSCVAFNDDGDANKDFSEISLSATAGTTYFLFVDGSSNEEGEFFLTISDPNLACVPDCDNLECGDDGCEGSCGTCDAGQCVNGACVEDPSDTPSPSPSPVAEVTPSPSPVAEVTPSPSPSPVAEATPSNSPAAEISPSASPVAEISPSASPAAEISPSASPVTEISPSASPVTEISPSASPVTEISPSASPASTPSTSPAVVQIVESISDFTENSVSSGASTDTSNTSTTSSSSDTSDTRDNSSSGSSILAISFALALLALIL